MEHQHMNHKKSGYKIYLLFIILGVVIGGAYIAYPKVMAYVERIQLDQENAEVMDKILTEQVLEKTVENIKEEIENPVPLELEEPVIILENAYLEVPFVCQAPLQTEANWVYHEESCEEAALLQVKYYLDGVKEVDVNKANEEILDMIAWQEKNFGSHHDIYANEMKDFIMGYYGIPDEDIEIIYDASIIDIKKAVSQGYPVIVPITGDLLRNPYYPYPGYHMLTVIGYTPDKVITNDVGTRRGANFSYDYDRFVKAMEDAGGDIVIIHQKPNVEEEEQTQEG